MPLPAILGPILKAGIPIVGGWLGSIFGGKAGKDAMKPSDEERGYLGRQGQLSDLLRGQGETTFNTGMPGITSAMKYYDTMARGDRAKMSQAIAPSVAQITDQYRGAEGGIRRNLRGAQRQQQLGELGRERASRLALLTTGQQPEAYDKLNQTGQALIGHSGKALEGAGDLMKSLIGNAAERRKYGMEVGRDVSKSKGGMLGDILQKIPWGKIPWPGGGPGAPGPGDITPEDTGGHLPSTNPVPFGSLHVPPGVTQWGGPTQPLPQYSSLPGAWMNPPPVNNLPPQWPGGPPPNPQTGGQIIDPLNPPGTLPPNLGPPPAPPTGNPGGGGYQYDSDNPNSPWYQPQGRPY